MLTNAEVASVIHEAVRQVQRLTGEEVAPSWDDAPEWMRLSTLAGVEGVLSGNTPEQSHVQWMETRLADGWVLGPVKSIADRISPNLVPYEDLPPAQKAKDHVVVSLTHALATPWPT